MAFSVQKINPLDLQPRRAIGIGYPISGGKNTFLFKSTYESREAVKSNLLTFFLTGKDERVLNNDLGSPLREFIFENINESTLARFRNRVQQILVQQFPRIQVIDLNIIGDSSNASITFYLKYAIRDTSYVDEEIVIDITQ